MPRARAIVVARYAVAAVIAAIAIPFIAHAAAGADSLAVPTATAFPTRQGVGVTWDAVDATAYRVERKLGTAEWQDASGDLAQSATTWVDGTLAAGATADYRVVALASGSQVVTSAPVTATRAAQDPAVGDVDVLMIDANRGDGVTWLQDEIAGPVTASGPTNGSRTLSAGTIKLKIPAILPGPGKYDLTAAQFELTQGDRGCTASGAFTVTALAYTPDLQLETMAASFTAWTCAGSQNDVGGEIRFKSAKGYSALSVDPYEVNAGQVRLGKSSASLPVKVKNGGTEPVEIDSLKLGAGYYPDWVLDSHNCPAVLPIAASCTANVTFKPTHTGLSKARLVIGDSTSLGWHTIDLTGTGTSLPNALDVFVSATFTGHTIRWPALSTAGGTQVWGYFLHRYEDGVESTQWRYAEGRTSGYMSVVDSEPTPGVQYAVSVVNEVGEGPTGTPKAAARATDQIAVIDGERTKRELMAADLLGQVVPFPTENDSVTPKEAVTSSPDGRSLAYVTGGADHALWTRRVDPSGFGTPAKLWVSPTPITHLSWSPDGSRIAFGAREGSGDSAVACVYVISSTGGTPEKIACDVTSPSWMPDARTLAVVDHRIEGDTGYLSQIEARSGGTRLKRFDVQAADGSPVRVSPGGQYIAYGFGSNVRLIGTEQGSTHQSADLGSSVTAISWNPSGPQLLALTQNGQLSKLEVAAGGSLTDRAPVTLWAADSLNVKVDVAWQQLGLMIKPTAAVMGPQISIPFDSSALLPGTAFSCDLPNAVRTSCTSPVVATITSSGTHSLSVIATEPGGRVVSATRTFTVDATGPVTRIVSPTYEASTAASATVRYAATDSSGVATYDVRYRKAPYNGTFGAYSQPWTNTAATSVSLGLAPGYEYCVSARARDKLGNLGAWSAERCFARPMDDRSLAATTAGWTRANWSAFYLGTATHTTTYGASLTRAVQGKRFYLVATRCNTCGVVSVYLGGKYIGAVNLWASTTQRQVVIGLPAQSSVFSGTLTIATRSTGKLIQIDGLAVRRV